MESNEEKLIRLQTELIELLKDKIKLLEDKVAELEKKPKEIEYIPIYPGVQPYPIYPGVQPYPQYPWQPTTITCEDHPSTGTITSKDFDITLVGSILQSFADENRG